MLLSYYLISKILPESVTYQKCTKKYTYTNVVDGISKENVSVVEVPTVALFTASVKNVHMLMISFA